MVICDPLQVTTTVTFPNIYNLFNFLGNFDLTCSQLKFDYVDLYLIHWPIRIKQSADVFNLREEDVLHFDLKEVWRAMEECCKLGLAKSIGVSNFSCAKLSKLLETAIIPPAVNQVRHVVYITRDLLFYTRECCLFEQNTKRSK